MTLSTASAVPEPRINLLGLSRLVRVRNVARSRPAGAERAAQDHGRPAGIG